ncbi:hypothetical protein D1224_15175 [Henriciella barbarensis]|uniref:ATP-grasp domain-containing protein n=1 Tax=Henriciella barbarensis TaxID=86342 RepID=A0A399QSB2_9PROT|nr:hypothetical protein [Henriciella barbarensis]RIJ20459.1 hypothetical protein D1224_15175 [Henriciella barbarensis]
MTSKPIDVIVLGLSPTGLYAVREAAQAGYTVLGVGAPGSPGLRSRFLTDHIAEKSAEARVAAVIKRGSSYQSKKPELIVTSDQDLAAVSANASALSKVVELPKSYKDGLAIRLMDKGQLYSICDTFGVSYPKIWRSTLSEAKSLKDSIAYPCMIKPARIHEVKHLMKGQKGWVVKEAGDFEATIRSIPDEIDLILVQEIVAGPESEIMLWAGHIDENGRVRQRFTARKLRQYPPGFGSASLVQSEVCGETASIAEQLLLGLGYEGVAAAEFKREPATGKLSLIEINPRPSLWFSVSTYSNSKIVESYLNSDRDTETSSSARQLDGVRWRYWLKDVASRLFYATHRDFILGAPNSERSGPARAHTSAVFSITDPRPALSEIASYAAKGFNRISRRR